MNKSKIAALAVVLALSSVALSSCGDRLVKGNNKAWMALFNTPLSTQDEPWKLVEGIRAFGPRFSVPDSITAEREQAIALVAGGIAKGLKVEKDPMGAYFAAADGFPAPEEHRDQFIARLTGAPTDLTFSFIAKVGEPVQLDLFVRRAMTYIDPYSMSASDELVTGQYGNELGWTLAAFSHSNLHKTIWRNYKNRDMGMETLLSVAISRPVNWGSYEGLIEQAGIATALRTYMVNRLDEEKSLSEAERKKDESKKSGPAPDMRGLELKGTWDGARKHVNGVLETMRQNQNPDGTFSATWHSGKQRADNETDAILYTALALDFMGWAMYDDELRDEMPRKAAKALIKSVEKLTPEILSENYFAAASAGRALRQYNDRLIALGGKAARYNPEAAPDDSACCD